MSRSYLFIPGDVPRMLQNLDVFDADAVIIDFEDSVADHNKDEARQLTAAFLKRYTFHRPKLYIRINSTDDLAHCKKDLASIKDLPIAGIVFPKMNVERLKILESLWAKPIDILGILETPDVFFEVLSLAKNPHVKGFLLGAEDLTKALNIDRSQDGKELLFARSQMIFAAASTNIEAIDTPFTDVLNEAGLIEDIKQATALGCTAKASIHPNHVAFINNAFTPSQEAITASKRIIAKSEQTQSMRFSLDGKMIDKPVIERARKLLKRAKDYGVL